MRDGGEERETDEPGRGWWPDPWQRHEHRFHNGVGWTADVADGGSRFVDPPDPGSPPPPRTTVATSPNAGSRIATVAAALGVASIAVGWLPFVVVVGALAAVVALVLGAIARRRAPVDSVGRRRSSIALVTGGLGLVAVATGAVFTVALVRAVDRFERPGDHAVSAIDCDDDGEAWTASGTIINLDDETRSYLVSVEFRRAGTDNARIRSRLQVTDVGPGESGSFSLRRDVGLDQVDCVVTRVDGPAPFGIDLGR
ncbi:MAG: hypothetical protein AAGG08_19485 [Actinomycetota bacterium]